MEREQLKRRRHAADRHDDAMRSFPERKGDQFIREMRQVVGELEDLCAEMPSGAPDLEWSKTHRWLGDAYYDLSGTTRPHLLNRGWEAYRRAEELFPPDGDPIEHAQRLVNSGNTLRAIAGVDDSAKAAEALDRYRAARAIFEVHDDSRVRTVDDLIAMLAAMLALMKVRGDLASVAIPDPAKATSEDVARLQGQIDRAASEVAVHAGQGSRALERSARTAGVDLPELPTLNAQIGEASTAASPNALLFDALVRRFEADVAEGKANAQRADELRAILTQLGPTTMDGERSLDQLAQERRRLEDLVRRVQDFGEKPSHGLPAPPEHSRSATVVRRWARAERVIQNAAMAQGIGSDTRDRARDILVEMAQAQLKVYAAGADDARVRSLEEGSLRAIVRDARRFALLTNLTLARPDFEGGHVTAHASQVFYAGRSGLRERLAPICDRLRLRLSEEAFGEAAGRLRWQQMREANVAVFDFTSGANEVERAAVSYELGWARAIGLPIVVVRTSDAPLPFDVDVVPVVLEGDSGDGALTHALDEAVYRVPSEPALSEGAVATAREMTARFRGSAAPGVSAVLGDLEGLLATPDPVAIEGRLRAVLLQIGDPRWQLLTPHWAARYPATPRLFHVMPFRPAWAGLVSDAVRAVHGAIEYRRHDHVQDENVIRSLWDEIGLATHVLVDLTDFNPNVAVELGFAHALGKSTLIVAQGASRTVDRLFPTIATRRVHVYNVADLGTLRAPIQRWLRIQDEPKGAPPALSRPRTSGVRAQFQAAITSEDAVHGLAMVVERGIAMKLGFAPSALVAQTVRFVRAYVASVPELLDAVVRVSNEIDVAAAMEPVLQRIEGYCEHLHDVISDDLGLVGVIDDAYFARQSIMRLQVQLGAHVPQMDVAIEAQIRDVMGEPYISQLDMLVAQLLTSLDAQRALDAVRRSGASPHWSNALDYSRAQYWRAAQR